MKLANTRRFIGERIRRWSFHPEPRSAPPVPVLVPAPVRSDPLYGRAVSKPWSLPAPVDGGNRR
jgi:hypothetical protein